jgi:hypothetical protein
MDKCFGRMGDGVGRYTYGLWEGERGVNDRGKLEGNLEKIVGRFRGNLSHQGKQRNV